MAVFAIGLYDIWDVSLRPAYREVVDKLVAKHGGRYVARTTNPWKVLVGRWSQRLAPALIEFAGVTPREELGRKMRAVYLCGMAPGPRAFTNWFWVVRGDVPGSSPSVAE